MKLLAIAVALVSALGTTAAISPTDPAYASSVLAIQDTINRYPLAIDSKNFTALADIFTTDVVANYSAPLGVLTGIPAIQSTLSKSLEPVTTQHGLSTQIVNLLANDKANTTSYFTAQHFGGGVYYGQIYTAYGRYEDELVLVDSGKWRIRRRSLIYMGPGSGNILIFANVPT